MLAFVLALALGQPAASAPVFLGKQVDHMLPQEDIGMNISVWTKWVSPSQAQFRVEGEVGDGVQDPTKPHPTTRDGDRYLRKLQPCQLGLDITGVRWLPHWSRAALKGDAHGRCRT